MARKTKAVRYEISKVDEAYAFLCALGRPHFMNTDAFRVCYPNSNAQEKNIKLMASAKLKEPDIADMYARYCVMLRTEARGALPPSGTGGFKAKNPTTTLAPVLDKEDHTEEEIEALVSDAGDTDSSGKAEVLKRLWRQANTAQMNGDDKGEREALKAISDIENMKKQENTEDAGKQTVKFYLPLRCQDCSLFKASQK